MKLNSIYGNPLDCYRCEFPDETRVLVINVIMLLGTYGGARGGSFIFRVDNNTTDQRNYIKKITSQNFIIDQINESSGLNFYCGSTSSGISLILRNVPSTGTSTTDTLTIEFEAGYSDFVIRSFSAASASPINITSVVSAGSTISAVYNNTCTKIY